MNKAKLKAVFDANSDCALATINSKDSPEVAIMGFADTSDFELVMGTSNESRKFQNIKSNPHVAAAIGWTWTNPITVQYEGIARFLEGDELSKYLTIYFAKQPDSTKYRDLPTQAYFVISPTLIRYSDYTNEPEVETFEIKF